MSNSSSVPDIQFTDTGVVLPTETAILTGVQADMNAAFGGNLNPALETPQGQLASSTAAIIGDKNDAIAAVVNNVDPDTAAGRWQDAVARIYFIDRLSSLPTVVAVTCVGAVGVPITTTAQVSDSNNNIYSSLENVTIPIGGSIVVQFANLVAGPIPCPAGTIVGPYKAINGWDLASNVADGIIGRDVESRADFEYRRKQSVALNANGSVQAVYANVLNVVGVSDAYAIDNPTSAPVTIGTVTLAANSIYVAAVGGEDSDLADAIFRKKSQGCTMNGNTSVVIADSVNYSPPYPSYTIKFQRPAGLPILFAITITDDPGLPADIVSQTQSAIIAAFNGQDGGARARIASQILASRYIPGVVALSPYVNVTAIKVGTSVANQDALTVPIDKEPTIDASNIVVTLA